MPVLGELMLLSKFHGFLDRHRRIISLSIRDDRTSDMIYRLYSMHQDIITGTMKHHGTRLATSLLI
jgi:hypothetical protein